MKATGTRVRGHDGGMVRVRSQRLASSSTDTLITARLLPTLLTAPSLIANARAQCLWFKYGEWKPLGTRVRGHDGRMFEFGVVTISIELCRNRKNCRFTTYSPNSTVAHCEREGPVSLVLSAVNKSHWVPAYAATMEGEAVSRLFAQVHSRDKKRGVLDFGQMVYAWGRWYILSPVVLFVLML